MSNCNSIISACALAAFLVLPSSAFADDNDNDNPSSPVILFDDEQLDAQDADENDVVDESDADDEIIDLENDADEFSADDKNEQPQSESVVKGHGLQLAMSFVGVPGYVLDHWFSEHGNVWDGDAVNMGFALDYFLRFKAPCEMRFSLSWVNAATGDAYWLDKNYSDRPHLADWIENNHSIVSLEIAAYHVVPIIDEIAFYYGGGFWGGVVLEGSKSYAVRSGCAQNADDLTTCPHEPGSVPMTQVPPVFGFVMATIGFKFTVLDVMTIRAEGGFKGYFYGQVGVGVEF